LFFPPLLFVCELHLHNSFSFVCVCVCTMSAVDNRSVDRSQCGFGDCVIHQGSHTVAEADQECQSFLSSAILWLLAPKKSFMLFERFRKIKPILRCNSQKPPQKFCLASWRGFLCVSVMIFIYLFIFPVTLCRCRKDYFEVPYAALRCTVEPTFAERSCIKHSEYLKKAKLVQSSAQSVSDSAVVTVSGDKIPYDFLVVCTGSTYTGPATKAERIKEYQAGR
jgi:hypothetical protein